MAEIGTIARPYAQAAFDVAKGEGNLAGWATFLEAAANLASNEEVRQLAQNPKIAKSQLVSLFEEAAKPTSDAHKNFLRTMVGQSRVDALPAVYETFMAHKNAFEGSADAHIVTAFAMSDVQVQELVAALEKKLGKKLKPEVSIDESLIGGFCVTVGDEVLDMSVRAKLARMQSALTA
jgi:F-type H+-transporting ATPase subunit delta